MKNHFSVLGVHLESSLLEIQGSWRRLAAEHHPDKGGDPRKFMELKESYSILTDKKSRASYLATLHVYHENCINCDGMGCIKRFRGWTSIEVSACPVCAGCGVTISEDSNEH